jgi:hypothetical protein
MISTDLEARQLLDVYLFHQIAIEEGRFYIHVVNPPSFVRRHGENQTHRVHPRHWCEGLFIVNALHLDISFHDEPSFMLDNTPLLVSLCLIHPL